MAKKSGLIQKIFIKTVSILSVSLFAFTPVAFAWEFHSSINGVPGYVPPSNDLGYYPPGTYARVQTIIIITTAIIIIPVIIIIMAITTVTAIFIITTIITVIIITTTIITACRLSWLPGRLEYNAEFSPFERPAQHTSGYQATAWFEYGTDPGMTYFSLTRRRIPALKPALIR